MVLMVEPGAYVAGVGCARREHMLSVTATGADVLTEFELRPPCYPAPLGRGMR